MKTRFTHNVLRSISGSLFLALAIVFFSSCSQKLTDISRSNKMQYALSTPVEKAPEAKMEKISTSSTEITNKTDLNVKNPGVINLPKTSENSTLSQKKRLALGVKHLNDMVKGTSEKIAVSSKQLLNSALMKKSNVASYHHTLFTGDLRVAIICLIIGLILGVLAAVGGPIGWLFWVLASVFFIIGVVFLLLWLLNQV